MKKTKSCWVPWFVKQKDTWYFLVQTNSLQRHSLIVMFFFSFFNLSLTHLYRTIVGLDWKASSGITFFYFFFWFYTVLRCDALSIYIYIFALFLSAFFFLLFLSIFLHPSPYTGPCSIAGYLYFSLSLQYLHDASPNWKRANINWKRLLNKNERKRVTIEYLVLTEWAANVSLKSDVVPIFCTK